MSFPPLPEPDDVPSFDEQLRIARDVPAAIWENFATTVLGVPKAPGESSEDYLTIVAMELSLRD